MRPLALDYQRTSSLPAKLGIMILAAGVGAVIQEGIHFRGLGQDISLWEARIAHIRHPPQRKAGIIRHTSADVRQLDTEMEHAREVLLQLALPWEDLFGAVEASANDRIALLSIEPDARKRQVAISGEARNLVCMLGYVKRLQENGMLAEVNLQSHQVYQQDPDKPVRFALVATWKARP